MKQSLPALYHVKTMIKATKKTLAFGQVILDVVYENSPRDENGSRKLEVNGQWDYGIENNANLMENKFQIKEINAKEGVTFQTEVN